MDFQGVVLAAVAVATGKVLKKRYTKSMKTYPVHRSSLGPDAHVVVAFIWFGGAILSIFNLESLSPLIAVVVLFLEKESGLVKGHAANALALTIFTALISILLTISIVGILFLPILAILLFIFAIIATLRGWKYQSYEMPWVQGIVRWLDKTFRLNLD